MYSLREKPDKRGNTCCEVGKSRIKSAWQAKGAQVILKPIERKDKKTYLQKASQAQWKEEHFLPSTVEKRPHAGNQKYPVMAAVKGVKGEVSKNKAEGELRPGSEKWNEFLQ